jgi:hypothetical protein
MNVRAFLAMAGATALFVMTSASLAEPPHAEAAAKPKDPAAAAAKEGAHPGAAEKGRRSGEDEHGERDKHAGKGKDDEKDKHEGRGKEDDKSPQGLADRDARHAKLIERFEERKRTMTERRKAAHDAIRRRWGTLVDQPPVREELRLHAMRVAKLERVKELAEADGKADLVARAALALERENTRHEKRMAAFPAGAGAPAGSASGGAP